jgi:hypothetical protein
MSKSTGAAAARKRKSSSRKAISHNLFGGAAVACLVLGCGWSVYSNILSASIYPTLGSARYDEPVVKLSPAVAARSVTQSINDSFAALPEQSPVIAKPAAVAAISATMFNERFAAAEPQGVASAVAAEPAVAAAPKMPAPKLAEAAKPVSAPKLAEAPKPKETAPAQIALNVPAAVSNAPEAKPAKPPGTSIRDMAQRAKAAVMSIATNDKPTVFEKLWGKQPSHGSLLSYASADASITGSLAPAQNPALGGSAPYDRSTAVYDISAHTVYLPDGSKLEAHSGLGDKLDDPRSAPIRMRGVTPPHIYELTPREALFHGVPALRLNPIGGEDSIYGRSGLLAHTFMLGPNGDSNGCVSFKDYNAFLNAYRNQGIKRLAVVARVE